MSELNWTDKDLGAIDAYAFAVENGYFTGTREQWYAMISGTTQNASDAEAYAKGTRAGEAVSSDDPAYENNASYWKDQAEAQAEAAEDSAEDAEAYAKGTRGGEAVDSDDPAYHNNSKYWKDESEDSAEDSEAFAVGKRGGVDVESSDPTYHNNAKYYRDSAAAIAAGDVIDDDAGAGDVNLTWSADKLASLKSALNNILIVESEQITFSTGGYIKAGNGQVATSTSGWKYTDYFPCDKYKKILIRQNFRGEAGIAFSTNNSNTGYISGTGITLSGTQGSIRVIDVPATAKYMAMSEAPDSEVVEPSVFVVNNIDRILDLIAKQRNLIDFSLAKTTILTPKIIDGFYIKTWVSTGATIDTTPIINGQISYAIIPCHAFDVIKITGHGSTDGRLWAFADTDFKRIGDIAGPNASATDLELVPPQDGYLIVNMFTNSTRSITQYTYYDIDEIIPSYDEYELDYTHVLVHANVSKKIEDYVSTGTVVNLTPQDDTVNFRCLAIDVKKDDKFVLTGLGATTARLYAFVDSDNKLINISGPNANVSNKELIAPADGKLVINITSQSNPVPMLKKIVKKNFLFNKGETLPMTSILFWGDSLTYGAGGGSGALNLVTYPAVCGALLSKAVMNCGVGGETANTVSARQGGNTIIIPVGDVNGEYTVDAFADIFGYHVNPLRQGDGEESGKKLYINGEECTLTISQTSATDQNATYTISGYTGGAITIPAYGRFKGSEYTGDVVVIFVGTNGSNVSGDTSLDARLAIIDSMISHIGHEQYIILGLSTGTSSSRATEESEMLKKYGNKFFPTGKMLVAYGLTITGITPTEQDNTDISAGTVPTSLRSDTIHLNANGYKALGKLIADKIVSLGYAFSN